MTEYTEISRILQESFADKGVHVRGWLHHRRSSGGILFLLIRDGTGVIQTTLKKGIVHPSLIEKIERIPIESVVDVSGRVKADERAPGGYEVAGEDITVKDQAKETFPIAKKYHGPGFLLDHRHLWLRSRKMQAVMRVRSEFLSLSRRWFEEQGFTEVQVPTLITAAVEGGSTLFEVKYFDKKAYLTQSWQLYAEAIIAGLGRIFTLAPSFRAEQSRTRRHLTEYWHLEAELPWASLEDIMELQENYLSTVCHKLAESKSEELRFLGRDPTTLGQVQVPFRRVLYDDAIRLLREANMKVEWGDDLGWRQEKVLASRFDQPFFVTHYPRRAKAFYHKPDPERPEVTLSADLLAPEGYGEIIGGGQRIDDLSQLLERMKENRLEADGYKWYVDLRKYGSVPHAGFGLGVERTLMWMCRLKHIRDAIAFPRLLNRVYP